MRYFILPVAILLCLSAIPTKAQTRRIAAASHSGAATERDLDNFGLNVHIREQMQQRYDSTRRADSVTNADSARVRVKRRRG